MAILTKTALGTGVTAKGATLTVAEGDNNTIEIVASIAAKEASINAAAVKATPVDADELGLRDSAVSFLIKKFTWANLKSVLKTYFDTLYQAVGSYAALAGSASQAFSASTFTGAGTGLTGAATGLTAGITNALKSATTTVNVDAAAAPITGQVLTATSSTTATWQTIDNGNWDNVLTVLPTSGSTVMSARGGAITQGGTVSHPIPSAGRLNQLRRSSYANIITTTNQILGISQNGGPLRSYWRGNAANLGGFIFRGKMTIELWPAATVRLFCGMNNTGTANVSSDTLAGDMCGLWHDTTMADTVLNFVTRDNVTTTSVAITLAAPLAVGQGFELIMECKPNDTLLYYKVIDLLTGNILADSSTSATLPRNTQFLGPEMAMSNGTANVTANTVAPAIALCDVKSPTIRP